MAWIEVKRNGEIVSVHSTELQSYLSAGYQEVNKIFDAKVEHEEKVQRNSSNRGRQSKS